MFDVNPMSIYLLICSMLQKTQHFADKTEYRQNLEKVIKYLYKMN